MIEKIKIVEYINKNKKGVYLELGSGGDSIGEIVDNVDPGLPLKIIVADLDHNVLNKKHAQSRYFSGESSMLQACLGFKHSFRLFYLFK